MLLPGSRFELPFTCIDSTGLPTAPTGTPTGTLVQNGTDLGTTVTVSMTGAQGVASCTIPNDAVAGDRFYLRISAVVVGATYVAPGPSEAVESPQTLTSAYDPAKTAAPTAAAIRSEMDNNSTKLANLDATVSSRLAAAGYTAPPSAETNASAVRTELATELGRIDAAVSTRATPENITSAMAGVAQSTDLVVISDVTDKLDGMLEADGLLWKFTDASLENVPESDAGATIVVQPLNASMPVKSVVPLLTFYRDEEGEVIGPIKISGRSGSTVTPVDLSGKTLEVVFLDYTGTTLLTVVDADITVSGTDNDQITFPVTTDLTGTVTEDHPDQYHYWSLRDVTSGNNVLVSGRARVMLG